MSVKHRTKRLHFVDALRVTLTLLVIAHHAGTPYGPAGGGWPITESRRTPLLGPFFAVNPMFFSSSSLGSPR
jgi:peptidoglycan/LPS O-acetylase OafA/YrhL